jgi:hypothetical protein
MNFKTMVENETLPSFVASDWQDGNDDFQLQTDDFDTCLTNPRLNFCPELKQTVVLGLLAEPYDLGLFKILDAPFLVLFKIFKTRSLAVARRKWSSPILPSFLWDDLAVVLVL